MKETFDKLMAMYEDEDDQNLPEEEAINSVYLEGVLDKLRETIGDDKYIKLLEFFLTHSFTAEGKIEFANDYVRHMKEKWGVEFDADAECSRRWNALGEEKEGD